jgi:fumarate reductase subunit D
MAIAKKSIIWALFAAGGTVSAFVYPALITLFLLMATNNLPDGLHYEQIHSFLTGWIGKLCMFAVVFLSIWHAAHRLRVVAHDVGIRQDRLVANVVYMVAFVGTVLTVFYLVMIR